MTESLETTVVPSSSWNWTHDRRNGPRTWNEVAACFWWVPVAIVLALVALVGCARTCPTCGGPGNCVPCAEARQEVRAAFERIAK